jgi:hypothetical protein
LKGNQPKIIALELFNAVKEKTYVMIFYEIMYRRLSEDVVKEKVHKRIYGEESTLNELTDILVEEAAKGKS